MNIRWRLAVAAFQLLIIAVVSILVTESPLSGESWFLAGLIPLIIHPLLFEPYFAKPPDVAGNSVVCLLVYYFVPKTVTSTGWHILAGAAGAALVLALFALGAGAGRKEDGTVVRLARSARAISGLATARRLYSAVFWLALVEQRPTLGERNFWLLAATWLVVLFVGQVNWRTVWSTVSGTPPPCDAEGMVGPSRLLISTSDLPEPGSWVSLRAGSTEAAGVVVTRIRRSGDVWAQVHIGDQAACEKLLGSAGLTIRKLGQPTADVVGAVDVGSTDTTLRFVAVRPLETGRVVAIKQDATEILYQLSAAEIEQSNVKGGSHLVVRVDATQLGHFDEASRRLRRHRWVPAPGAAVVGGVSAPTIDPATVPQTWMRLGYLIGTEVPVYLDTGMVCEGHSVILGMTKMGKTSLAARLANMLGATRPVLIFDQTGEYINVRGFPPHHPDEELAAPSVSVLEPPHGQHPAVVAYTFLGELATDAQAEYVAGDSVPRTLLMDEAHQFIPETFGMAFGTPERNAAENFGRLMMQIRKYGISIVMVSQRTAVISKSALSQCENFIAFRYVDKTGLEYLETVAGPEARKLVPKLEQGQALVFGPAISSDAPVAIQVEWEPAGSAE